MFSKIWWKHDALLQSHSFIILVLFTAPFYHFFCSQDIWIKVNVTFCHIFWFHFQIQDIRMAVIENWSLPGHSVYGEHGAESIRKIFGLLQRAY